MAAKTNAMRTLDRLGITYQVREYDVDPDDLSAETVAAKVGLPPEQVFKTLAVQGDRTRYLSAVIPGNTELDFKALAGATGDRKIDMVPLKDVQAVTGYIRGGVTALACKKDYPVFVDETAELWDVISISAGQRGIQIFLHPADYIRAVDATPGRYRAAEDIIINRDEIPFRRVVGCSSAVRTGTGKAPPHYGCRPHCAVCPRHRGIQSLLPQSAWLPGSFLAQQHRRKPFSYVRQD